MEAKSLIIQAIRDEHWRVRQEAIKTVRENKMEDAVPFLIYRAKNDSEKLAADDAVSGTLKTLFAVAENYPDLKANENFLQLQSELSDIENKIAAARRFFNSCVKDYNTAIESFPSNLIAKAFGFKHYDFFAIESKEKEVPQVQF